MKKYIKSFFIMISLLCVITITATAKTVVPSNVKLEGDEVGIFFIPGDEPFLYNENMLPGDSAKRDLIIENNHNDEYDLYIRAEKITPDEKYDLIRKLELKVKYEDKLLYKGDMSGEERLKGNIYLGSIKPGEKKTLNAEVDLDGKSTGNEYKNKFGQVNWIFTAVKKVDNEIKLRSSKKRYNTSLINIGKNNIQVDEKNKSDNLKKIDYAPKTGDSGIMGYAIVGIGSFMLFLRIAKRK